MHGKHEDRHGSRSQESGDSAVSCPLRQCGTGLSILLVKFGVHRCHLAETHATFVPGTVEDRGPDASEDDGGRRFCEPAQGSRADPV